MSERMTSPDDLLALADRCEREEPSRHLDSAILVAVGHQTLLRGGKESGWTYRPNGVGIWLNMPSPTTSLDAAVTLVPENFSYELAFSAAGDGAMRRARLWDWRRGPLMVDPHNEWASTAKTLPLALCGAALRARAAAHNKTQE